VAQRARDHTLVVRPKHLQYYQENQHKSIGHKRFFRTSAAAIASNYVIPPADLPRAFAVSNLTGSANHDNRIKRMTMRKMIYVVGAVAIAVVATGYVWSHSTQIPSLQRVMATEAASMTSPTEMMTNYNRPLPVEQWDAF